MTSIDITASELRASNTPSLREQISAELDRLNPLGQPTSALVVTAFEDDLVEIGDDYVQIWCSAAAALRELKALPTGAALGVQDPEPGTVWYALAECEA